MKCREAVDQTTSHDAGTAEMKIARAAVDYMTTHHQAFDIGSIKALLQRSLDAIRIPLIEYNSHLDDALSKWLDLRPRERNFSLLIYILGNKTDQYTNRNIRRVDLDAIDKVRARILDQQCLRRGACLYLAQMTSVVDNDPDDVFNLKMIIRLHDIRDLKGRILSHDPVAAERESIIQRNHLVDRYYQATDRREPYPSPSKRSPTSQTDLAKSFQDWVLVIMPTEYRPKFLKDYADPEGLHQWIESQSRDLPKFNEVLTETRSKAVRSLILACEIQLDEIAHWCASGLDHGGSKAQGRRSSMLEAVICASLRIPDSKLFGKAVTLFPRMLSLKSWAETGGALDLVNFLSYSHPLAQALDKIDSLQDRYVILKSIREGCKTQKNPLAGMKVVDDWFQDQIEHALTSVMRVEENDGAILVIVAKRFTAIDFHRVISFATKHCYNYQFTIECAFSLYDAVTEKTIDRGQAKHLLQEILTAALPVLSKRGSDNWIYKSWCPSRVLYTSEQDQQTTRADRMAHLIRCCLSTGLFSKEGALLSHFLVAASTADVPLLRNIFLPYLKQLPKLMDDWHIALTTPLYQSQFQKIVSRFVALYVCKEPTPPSSYSLDLTCPPLSCASVTNPFGCIFCIQLDIFLGDPRTQAADFGGGIDIVEHIADQVHGINYLSVMTTITPSADPTQPMESDSHTIRITKHSPHWGQDPNPRHELWNKRFIKAKGMLHAICGDEEWKLLLGEKYDECMRLEAVMRL